jgi:dihydroorotase
MNPASEYVQLERDLELVRDTGCRYHACHLSARVSVELVRSAKRGGLPVSCEVTPHHLLLCDGDISDDGRFKMNPPLRSAADRRALLEGLLDGAIDMIATDHAPHSAAEKGGGLRGGAMGVTGLEAAFRVLYTRLVSGGTAGLELLADKMAASPGRLFGIGGELTAGGPADLCVITPGGRAAIDPGDFLSKGRSTPFEGMETEGDILMTIKGGQVAWRKTAQEK